MSTLLLTLHCNFQFSKHLPNTVFENLSSRNSLLTFPCSDFNEEGCASLRWAQFRFQKQIYPTSSWFCLPSRSSASYSVRWAKETFLKALQCIEEKENICIWIFCLDDNFTTAFYEFPDFTFAHKFWRHLRSRCRLDNRQYLAVFATSEVDKVRQTNKQTKQQNNKTCDTENKQMWCSQTLKEPEESPLLCDALLLQVRYRSGNLRSVHLKTADLKIS